MKTFSDRKKMQKLAYIAQKIFGVNLDCNFTWYIHGPYAPDLTRTLFEITENPQIAMAKPDKDKVDLAKVERMRSFLGDTINSTDKLELLGSLHYLKSLGKSENASDLEIMAVLREKKPFFSPREVAWAWQKLSEVD
jgi:uncharacterized protein YwgA